MVQCYENQLCKIHIIRVVSGKMINYSYIVIDKISSSCFIIDPAWEIEKFESIIVQENIRPTYILLTHHHFDHCNLVEEIVLKYNCTIICSEREREYFPDDLKIKYIPHKTVVYVGNITISCLLTAGHTKGSMCYLMEGFLFSGDTIFIEGVGICGEYSQAPQELYNSICFVKKNINREVIVLPGHRFQFEFGKTLAEIIHINIYFKFTEEEDFIKFRTRKNQTMIFDFI